MRFAAPGILLLALVAAGCCTTPPPEIIGPAWGSPEQAFRTFRAAVLTDRPGLLFDSLSPRFRDRYGVPGRVEFESGYRKLGDELSDLRRALEKAKAEDPVYLGPDPATGLNRATIEISAYGRSGRFLFVEIPTVHVVTQLPGYEPQPADFFARPPAFSGNHAIRLVLTEDGWLVGAVAADEAGVASLDEVKDYRFYRQWLLLDILDLPIDVRRIIDELRRSGGDATP